MKQSKKKVETKIEITSLELGSMKIKLQSLNGSSLLFNKPQPVGAQIKGENKNKVKKSTLTAQQKTEIADAKIHKLPNGKPGIPTQMFHNAMIEAAPYIQGMNKKLVSGVIRFMNNIAPLKYKSYSISDVWAYNQNARGAQIRNLRPEFHDWQVEVLIRYNASQITPHSIIELLKYAGFTIGVGSWRPVCKGNHGMFEVVSK